MRELYFIDPHIEERFWRFADAVPTDECWVWKGHLNPKGYARLPARINGEFKQLRAYVVAWEIAWRERWPDGMMACHSCDNPACVNPYHVRPGTGVDNYADMASRGRAGGAAAVNAGKDNCIHGHPLSGENLIVIQSTGARRCRQCTLRAKRDYRERRKALA
jgi:hypothetical protein